MINKIIFESNETTRLVGKWEKAVQIEINNMKKCSASVVFGERDLKSGLTLLTYLIGKIV